MSPVSSDANRVKKVLADAYSAIEDIEYDADDTHYTSIAKVGIWKIFRQVECKKWMINPQTGEYYES